MRYGRTDFFPWGCYSGKLSALSDSPSHKRKSWSTQESLRSVDAVEKLASTLTASVEFPEFHSEQWPGPWGPLGHQKGREASRASGWYPYRAAPSLQCLRADCSWESHVQNKCFTVKTWDLMVIPSFCMICSSKTQQWSSLLLSTSGYVLGWRLSTLSSLSQIEDFPIRGRKGGE